METPDEVPRPLADAHVDYDRLMRANVVRVFSEPDAAKRLAALAELWAADGTLVEPEAVARGYEAISASVGALLERLPPGTAFVPEGTAAGHHDLGRLRWRVAARDGSPGPVSGTDVAFIEDGRIGRLHVILDPQA